MDADWGLLILLVVGALLLGPIGFFLALGARSRARDADRESQTIRRDLQLLARRLDAIDASVKLANGRPADTPVGASAARRPAFEAAPTASTTAASVAATIAPPSEAVVLSESKTPETDARSPRALESEAHAPEADLAAPAGSQPPTVAEPKPQIRPPSSPTSPLAAPTPEPSRTLEEALGTRWAVWVGGFALALGAILLVRYSIEQGFFGPGFRTALGLALACALVGAGEFLRRKERDGETPALFEGRAEAAYIPGVLTAAGTVAAFGSIYAAYALYGFIGPTIAFLALGATGLACMAAAALHGPALAALGLLGSLATPVLVSSQRPNPWPVVLYLAVVVAAAYLLSRVRGWLWLALASAAGAGLWALLLRSLADPDRSGDLLHAALLHVLLQTALASYFLAIDPHRGESDEAAVFDPPANAVLAALGIVALFVLHLDYHWSWFGGVWLLAAAGVIAILGLTGARTAAAAGASASAGVVALAALMLWPPVIGSPAQWPSSAIFTARWPAPAEPMWFALFAAVSCLGVGAAAGRRLLDGPRLRFGLAGFYAGAAALTPLGGLIIADLRLSGGAPSIAMSIAAALVGAVLAFGASRFRDKPGAGEATRLGLGALASGAIGAVGAGLVFALDGGALIVALALAAVGTAFVAARLNIGALRWCVAALGVAVAGRLAWEPRIVGDALSATPVFNWLLFGYGVPAAAFAQAARFMRQRAEDTPVRVADALAILFSAFLFFFEIRHAMNSGDPYAPGSGLVEQALLAVSSFGFAVVLTRLDAARANVVFRYASLGAGALGMALAAWGLLLRYNPLFDGRPVEGGAVLNALILGYLIPALLAAALALVARRVRPLWYWGGAGALGGVLSLLYAALQVRIFFHGSSIGFEQGAGVAELGVDVCLCLTLAGALLLRAPSTKPSLIVRGSMAFSALAAAIGVVGLAGLANPLVSGAPIGGGGAFNALIIGYALPSLFTLILARLARRMREPLYAAAASFAAIAWLFAYASLEVRRAFQGPTIGFEQWTSNGEWYAYSAVWLLLGIALLAYGVWRGSREARFASAFFVVVTAAKVFLFDLAGLEGILRAVSFIGLGLALIGIGLVYQKLVFARSPPSKAEGVDPRL